ncbi:MAG: alpha/beta hydrolase [Dehalococcoidales bacterium]|nr:alpha/beta hydrolase [Dehalococcoidales bacterium]
MAKQTITSGYSANELPYSKIGDGPKQFVVFEGLNFTHKPPSKEKLGMDARMFRGFPSDYTIWVIGRKPGLPEGSSVKDWADDYANMVREEIGAPVDIGGISTGGPPALCFAADYPELTRKLVLVSTGYRLSDYGKKTQLDMLRAARTGNKRATAAFDADLISKGFLRILLRGFFWCIAPMMYEKGDSLADGIAELEAEDAFNFKDRLGEIKVPTLVIGGAEDPLYPMKETAEEISGAKLILYEKAGHGASMKKEFKRDLVAFLEEKM